MSRETASLFLLRDVHQECQRIRASPCPQHTVADGQGSSASGFTFRGGRSLRAGAGGLIAWSVGMRREAPKFRAHVDDGPAIFHLF